MAQEALEIESEMRFVQGVSPEVLTQIYDQDVHLCNFQRDLALDVTGYCEALLQNEHLNIRAVIQADDPSAVLNNLLPEHSGKSEFIEDLALIIDMYACLFELDEVGLRLQVLDRAMCPRFHTDKLGCRLVSTYAGQGTEWLEDPLLDRSKLGAGNGGLSDDKSGLYGSEELIHQAQEGDVLLLKGDGWYGLDGKGVVHRSPMVPSGQSRLVATLDFA
ncbi:DUF1826 domain-containing protein [Neptuniibacter sp. QD48_11]|uniref:DUF1826 domain-containing protein n=1 Tax=unclassified Neptuniibacter TaxID=2630693 RepID=UPI0039F58F58